MPTHKRLRRREVPSFDAEATWFDDLLAFINADGPERPWIADVRLDLRRAIVALLDGHSYESLAGPVSVGGPMEPPHDRAMPTPKGLGAGSPLAAAVTPRVLAISQHYISLFRLAHLMDKPGGPRLWLCPDCERRVLLNYRRSGSGTCQPCKQKRYRDRRARQR